MLQKTIFLTPVAREEAFNHFRDSVLNTDEPVWGVSEGVSSQWENISVGDILLFYTGNFKYEFGGKVKKKQKDYKLSEELFRQFQGDTGAQHTRGGGGPWPYLIYFLDVFEVEISSEELHEYADYGNNYPMKFHALNSLGHSKIKRKFGSVEEYIRQKRTN